MRPSDYLLRRAKVSDLPALAHIFSESILVLGQDHYSLAQRQAWVKAMTPGKLHDSVNQDITWVVVDDEDRPAGFVSLSLEKMELDLLYVLPSVAGKGYGKLLLQEAEKTARENGLSHLRLVSSLNALDFYLHQGYGEGAHMCRRVSGMELPCIQMSKSMAEHPQS